MYERNIARLNRIKNDQENPKGCRDWSRTSDLLGMNQTGYHFPTLRHWILIHLDCKLKNCRLLATSVGRMGSRPNCFKPQHPLSPTRLRTALDGLAESNGLASSRLTLPTIPMRVGSRLSGMSGYLSAHRSQHGAVSLPCGFILPESSGDNSADLHLPYTQPREGNACCWRLKTDFFKGQSEGIPRYS